MAAEVKFFRRLLDRVSAGLPCSAARSIARLERGGRIAPDRVKPR